jgi:hypothetical protein
MDINYTIMRSPQHQINLMTMARVEIALLKKKKAIALEKLISSQIKKS